MVFTGTLQIETKGFTDILDVTDGVLSLLRESEIGNGLLTVFCTGSTGAITTIEYEPGVVEDLRKAIERIAPSNIPYAHDKRWGDSNGFSHVRAALMKPSLTIPVVEGSLTLGTWQQVVLIDLDNRPRERKLVVQIVGESSKGSDAGTPTIQV